MTIILFIVGVYFIAIIYEKFFKSSSINDIKKNNNNGIKRGETNRSLINSSAITSNKKITHTGVINNLNNVSSPVENKLVYTPEFKKEILIKKDTNKDVSLSELDFLSIFYNEEKIVAYDDFHSNGLLCFYLHDYYPLRYKEVSDKDKENRKTIYNFKDGLLTDKTTGISREISTILVNNYSRDVLKETVFVCLPASTQQKYKKRYANFSEQVCKSCGMLNFFPHVSYLWDRKAKHIEGITPGNELSHITFPQEIVNGKNVIIFDDIITTGKSLHNLKDILQTRGATVSSAIFIGKTYDQYQIKKEVLRKTHALIED